MTHFRLDFSAGQTSIIGRILNKGYYGSGQLRELINIAPNRSGYPHNGGQHTLEMSGKKEEILAWLELFEETTGVDLSDLKDTVIKSEKFSNIVAWRIFPILFQEPVHLTIKSEV